MYLDWGGEGGALELRVDLGHAGVESLQGVEGGVVGLLQEHVAWGRGGVSKYRD